MLRLRKILATRILPTNAAYVGDIIQRKYLHVIFQTGYTEAGVEGVLCQVQRPNLCKTGEIGYHDQID